MSVIRCMAGISAQTTGIAHGSHLGRWFEATQRCASGINGQDLESRSVADKLGRCRLQRNAALGIA